MSTTTRPAYDLSKQTNLYGYSMKPIEKMQKQLGAIEEIKNAIHCMKKNLESSTARAFIPKMEEMQEAFEEALQNMAEAIEAMQYKANLFEEIENKVWEIEEEHYRNGLISVCL
jgi:CRISPR/Cas system CSM-associated protein Csm2 small subunit